MQIELLETFLDLMETNSFNRTAERLGITQSTVSSRINTLETSLGRKLFNRSRAGTRPTVAGDRLADHARTIRHEWNAARRAVQGARNFARSMRIGIQSDLAATHIGEWVIRFRKALPETSFYVEMDFSNQMCSDLLAGDLDLAVVFTPKRLPDLHFETVGEISYRMISAHAECLATIEPERYVSANYSLEFDRYHRQALPELADAPVSSGQNMAVSGLLSALGGTAYVLEETARQFVAAGDYRFVADAGAIRQTVYLAVHVRNRHSHPHKKLLAIVRQYFGQIA